MAVTTGQQATRFVIVTSQRTGSTLLVRSLDQADEILCAGEIFHSGPNRFHAEFKFPRRIYRSHLITRFVDVQLSKGRIHRHLTNFYGVAGQRMTAVGFKLMISHTRTFPDIVPILEELGVSFVYLCRNDTFATARSYYRARVTRVFHKGTSDTTAGDALTSADDVEFKRMMAVCESDKQQLLQLRERLDGPLLSYEEMVADWDGFILRFGETIGISGLSVPQVLAKLRPGVDSAMLTDEDELSRTS